MIRDKDKILFKNMVKHIHIDDAQSTIDEHFSRVINDNSTIESTFTKFTKDDLPEWYNEELFKKGQKYYRRNKLAAGTAALSGLLAVLAIPSVLKILIWTKKSSTPCTAFTRYLETVLLIYHLYTSDINDPNSRFWKSINSMRYQHSTNSRKSINYGLSGITQRDMALTQFGFIGYVLIAAEKLSLTNEREEREGFNHFWRIVGYAIGISDSLNICRKNEAETTKLCERLRDEVFALHMKNTPDDFIKMSSAMLDGMWCIDPALNYDSFISFWYNLTGVTYDKSLGLGAQLSSMYRSAVFYLLGTPYIGFFVREGFNHYLSFNYWLLEHWQGLAWLRFGIKNSRIQLYANKLKE